MPNTRQVLWAFAAVMVVMSAALVAYETGYLSGKNRALSENAAAISTR